MSLSCASLGVAVWKVILTVAKFAKLALGFLTPFLILRLRAFRLANVFRKCFVVLYVLSAVLRVVCCVLWGQQVNNLTEPNANTF